MIYRINICDYCKKACRLDNADDFYCPFCGAKINTSYTADSGVLAAKLIEKQSEIDKLKQKIETINQKTRSAAESKDTENKILMTEIEKLKSQNDVLSRKIKKSEEALQAESRAEKLITAGKTNADIFLQFINITDKKNNPLPLNFKKAYLDLSGTYILDGRRGTDTSVYICKKEADIFEIYPNELIVSPVMRDYYNILYEFANKDGKSVISIEPCLVETSNTGYYNLLTKGNIAFE